VTLDALFGDLRAALHAPSQGSWSRVLRLFREGAEVSPEVVEGSWAPYARDLLERSWPDRLRRPPPDWFDDPFLSDLALDAPIRPSEWPGGERIEIDVQRIPKLETYTEFATDTETPIRDMVVHPSEPLVLLVHEPRTDERLRLPWSTWALSPARLLMRGEIVRGETRMVDVRGRELAFFLDADRFAYIRTKERTTHSKLHIVDTHDGITREQHDGPGARDIHVLDADQVDVHTPEVLLAHARADVWFEHPSGEPSSAYEYHASAVLHPHGDKIAVMERGRAVLQHAYTGAELLESPFEVEGGRMYGLTLSPDGRHIAMFRSTANDCVVHCARSGRETLCAHVGSSHWHYNDLSFSRDGALSLLTLATYSDPTTYAFVVLDGASREVLGAVRHTVHEMGVGSPTLARFTHDSSAILLSSAEGITRHPLPTPVSSP